MTAELKTSKPKGTTRFNRPDDLLVGRCFCIIDADGAVERQGFIWGRVEPGFYLIQYFEAFMGQPNDMQVVSLQTITEWRLEEDDEMLRFQMEYGGLGKRSERAIEKRLADKGFANS